MLSALLWLVVEAMLRQAVRPMRAGASSGCVQKRAPVTASEPSTLPAPVVRRLGGTPAACRLRLRVWGWTASAYVFAFAWFVFVG